jgi:hypothetical protein
MAGLHGQVKVDGQPLEGDGRTTVLAMITNLLPQANSTLTLASESVYMVDGLPLVLLKLAAKIGRDEFVEMGDLLPEFRAAWRDDKGDGRKDLKPSRKTRKTTDICTWVQCFSS